MGRTASKRKKSEQKEEPNDAPNHRIEYRDSTLLPAVVVSVLALLLYSSSLYPELPPGDAGELITAADQLGVAHPPGYPLFVLLGKAFILLLPIGSVAYRVNVMCVCCGAGAAGMLAAAATEWTGVNWAGMVAGLLFALSPNAWF